jgi:hypothetical protein
VHAHHGLAGIDRAMAGPADRILNGEEGAGETFSTWTNVSHVRTARTPGAAYTLVNSYTFRAPHRSTICFGESYRARSARPLTPVRATRFPLAPRRPLTTRVNRPSACALAGIEAFLVPSAHDETLLVSSAFSMPTPGLGGTFLRNAQRGNPLLVAVLHRLGAGVVCQDAALAEAEGLDELRGERWTGERTKGGLTTADGAVIRTRKWLRRSGGPPLQPTSPEAVRRWRVRRHLSVWEMHTRDCPTCRRAHDDAEFTAKALLGVSAVAAAAGHVPAAISLLGTAELSRATANWFETFEVRFPK